MNLTNKVVIKQDESRPILYKHYWVTKDKRVLFPQDFELGHLERTLEYIKKNAINYYYQASDRLQEIAMRMHSKALNKRQTTDSLYVFFVKNTTLYKELENEIQKRKNPPKPKAVNPLKKPPTIKKDIWGNTVSQSTASKTNPLIKKKLPF